LNIRNSTILVTGGAGFIGSHIVKDLVHSGANIRVLDNFSSGLTENLDSVKNHIEVIKGDILDMDTLLQAASGVDAISHQAAQLEIMSCIAAPVQDLRVNVEGTLNVLEAAKRLSISKVIYASSACVYGQAHYLPEDEMHPTVPNWPYGVSKLAAEHYARLYYNYYDIETVGLRYSIVYGPGEWYGRVLTVFLRRALERKPPVVWKGDQERDFVYIDDVVRFHRLALERHGLRSQIFNVSTGVGTSIRQLAVMICELFDLDNAIYEDVDQGQVSHHVAGRIRLPAELRQMILANDKARTVLGWSPEVRLKEGILAEMEWLRNHEYRWTVMHY
jgi:UDP-glucose 4-epimerase